MNVEQAYVKSNEKERVIKIVKDRISNFLEISNEVDRIEVPDSYNVILENYNKRKVAISSPVNGWISILESKEVNDYNMLLHISDKLQTDVLAIIQSDITGSWGYVEMLNGKIIKSYFSEEDDEIEDLINDKLQYNNIIEPIYMFREIVKNKAWDIVCVK